MNTIRLNTIGEVVAKTTSNSSTGNSTGGGIPIVKSIEELEALNLPAGSVASVANNELEKKSIRDLYQPTLNEISFDAEEIIISNPYLLSSVKKLEFTAPSNDFTPTENSGFVLAPRGKRVYFDNSIAIQASGMDYAITTPDISIEGSVIKQNEDGSYSVDQNAVDTINSVLSTNDWCYIGIEVMMETPPTEADFQSVDAIIKVVDESQVCDVYFKDLDNIVPIERGLLADSIDKVASMNLPNGASAKVFQSYEQDSAFNQLPEPSFNEVQQAGEANRFLTGRCYPRITRLQVRIDEYIGMTSDQLRDAMGIPNGGYFKLYGIDTMTTIAITNGTSAYIASDGLNLSLIQYASSKITGVNQDDLDTLNAMLENDYYIFGGSGTGNTVPSVLDGIGKIMTPVIKYDNAIDVVSTPLGVKELGNAQEVEAIKHKLDLMESKPVIVLDPTKPLIQLQLSGMTHIGFFNNTSTPQVICFNYGNTPIESFTLILKNVTAVTFLDIADGSELSILWENGEAPAFDAAKVYKIELSFLYTSTTPICIGKYTVFN